MPDPISPQGLETREFIQRRYGAYPGGWFGWLIKQLDIPAPGRILDLGSGSGMLWRVASGRIPAGWRITLTDRSMAMLRQSVREFDLPPIAGRALLDAHDLPFASGAFSAALAIGLFDLLPERERTLAEVRRALAPDGRLYASGGGQAHLKELLRLLQPFAPGAHIGGLPETFGLENGRQQLLGWFSRVELRIFRDTLVFDQVEPVLAYILSEQRLRDHLPEERRDALIESVRRELAERGQLRVTVEKGLFVAQVS